MSMATFLAALDLVPDGEDAFLADSIPTPRGRVFGGQMLAQALLAAGRTVEPDRHPHSLHGYFMRPGDPRQKIRLEVERMRDGRSFATRNVHALQEGLPTLALAASFQFDQDGVQHAEPMPEAAAPESVPSWIDRAVGEDGQRVQGFWSITGAFDLRNVTDAGGPPSAGRDHLVWMRMNVDLGDASRLVHTALLAAASDFLTTEPVLRRHDATPLTPGIRTASLDHAMWFHRPARVDQWLLVRATSPAASGGRGLTRASVFAEDGTHVASFAQEVMIRLP